MAQRGEKRKALEQQYVDRKKRSPSNQTLMEEMNKLNTHYKMLEEYQDKLDQVVVSLAKRLMQSTDAQKQNLDEIKELIDAFKKQYNESDLGQDRDAGD